LQAFGIPKLILGRRQSRAKADVCRGAIGTEIYDSAVGNGALKARKKKRPNGETKTLRFTNAARRTEHHRLLVKVAKDRGAAGSLEAMVVSSNCSDGYFQHAPGRGRGAGHRHPLVKRPRNPTDCDGRPDSTLHGVVFAKWK
jgi:hypothetical protein